LSPDVSVGTGKVYKVSGVGDDSARLGTSAGLSPFFKLGVADGCGLPLALVFQEDLQAIALQSPGGLEGVMEAAGDGQVCSQ